MRLSASPPVNVTRGLQRRKLRLYEPPSSFSLRSGHDQIANFLQHLVHGLYNRRTDRDAVGVDFRALRSVAPGAGLLLAAELDRVQRFVRRRLRAVAVDQWDPAVATQLRDMGLFDLLDVPVPEGIANQEADRRVTFIKYMSGVEVSGARCAGVLDHLAEIAGRIEAETLIYDGLVEAIKNVKHHAYEDVGKWYGVPDGTWWMCGAYLPAERQLTVTVYDLGIGIPHTLPRSTIWENVRPFLNLFGSNDDASMIAGAMEAGRTRTLQPQRGKGLPIMMRVFEQHVGHLRILSGRGEATYSGPASGVARTTHDLPISGTLIEWHVRQTRDGVN